MKDTELNKVYKLCKSLHERVSNHSELLQKMINGLTNHERDIEELKTIVSILYVEMPSMNDNQTKH